MRRERSLIKGTDPDDERTSSDDEQRPFMRRERPLTTLMRRERPLIMSTDPDEERTASDHEHRP